MIIKFALAMTLILIVVLSCIARDEPESKPIELEVLKGSVGVWDAELEVWPKGPDSSSIKFAGVETNRPYGEYWIASDFDSHFMGDTIRVHSIVGYDLEERRLFGMIIDHGPYSATMTGDYDSESKTVTWMTEARHPSGEPMVQKTSVTQKNDDERELVLMMPGGQNDDFITVMRIRFVKRKQVDDPA